MKTDISSFVPRCGGFGICGQFLTNAIGYWASLLCISHGRGRAPATRAIHVLIHICAIDGGTIGCTTGGAFKRTIKIKQPIIIDVSK